MCVCVIRWSQTHSMCTQWWMIWPGWVQNNWGLHRLALLKYFEKERPEIAHGRFNHQFVEFMEMIHGRFQWKEIKKWKCSGTIYYPFTGSWVPDLKCRNTAEKAVIFLLFLRIGSIACDILGIMYSADNALFHNTFLKLRLLGDFEWHPARLLFDR